MADEDSGEKVSNGQEPSAEQPLTRAERSLVRRFSSALRFADFMAVLMVLATGLSAYATLRTAQLMHTILMVSERPYMGVQQVKFDSFNADSARIAVELRNFGSVSANDVVSQVRMLVNGHQSARLNRITATVNIGIVSPSVPHLAYRFLPLQGYQDVRDGKMRLVIDVLLSYRGPDERQFCYNEIFTFNHQSEAFEATGGGDRCGSQIL